MLYHPQHHPQSHNWVLIHLVLHSSPSPPAGTAPTVVFLSLSPCTSTEWPRKPQPSSQPPPHFQIMEWCFLLTQTQLGTGCASLEGIQIHRCAEMKLLGMFQQGNFSMRANLFGHYFSLFASAESPPCCFCLSSYPRAGGTQKHISVLKTDRLQNGLLYLEGQKSLRKRGMLRLL